MEKHGNRFVENIDVFTNVALEGDNNGSISIQKIEFSPMDPEKEFTTEKIVVSLDVESKFSNRQEYAEFCTALKRALDEGTVEAKRRDNRNRLDLDSRFGETELVVQATSTEIHYLELEFLRRNPKIMWIDNNPGISLIIGKVGDKDINVAFRWAVIKERVVLFVQPISVVVDWDLVDKFVAEVCPGVKYTNALNASF